MTTQADTAAPARDGRHARWAEHRATRRRDLVEHTLRAIRIHGPGVGMDEIAAQAGTSKPVLYRHFGDRNGVYLGVVEAVDARVLAELSAVADRSGHAPDGAPADVTELIRAMVSAYLELVQRDPDIYRFVVTRPLLQATHPGAPGVDAAGTLTGRIGDRLAEILAAHLRRCGRDPAPAVTWGHGIAGFVRAATDQWVSHRPPGTSADTVTAEVIQMLRPALQSPQPDAARLNDAAAKEKS
ncbi:MAG TPA: TetR/AcrR family transcriptional regulator [Ornithinimicrobium sp.]|uniref:TetR/AcrR family transcriptional regulator n=1 Tax=Ornithinimicrobium sp. TaxID=1977084 RepID=UPI002B460175|nr:TetR/AcrR family transcriptional regulator [Ornithinimicrobium sp.]HKJ11325.1 TetR/AcrR family transcriptional regulator [Ornithinimicrobium sp.]